MAPGYTAELGTTILEADNLVFTEGGDRLGDYLGPTRSLFIDPDAARATAFAQMEAALDWDTVPPTMLAPESKRFNYSPGFPAGVAFIGAPYYPLITVQYSRFRWVVPDSHTGSFFRVQWDVLDTPSDAPTFTAPASPGNDPAHPPFSFPIPHPFLNYFGLQRTKRASPALLDQPEMVAVRPIDDQSRADEIDLRDRTPDAAVGAAQLVVAHGPVDRLGHTHVVAPESS